MGETKFKFWFGKTPPLWNGKDDLIVMSELGFIVVWICANLIGCLTTIFILLFIA